MLAVSNTSPICYLTVIGCVDILHELFDCIVVPPTVLEELSHPTAPAPVHTFLSSPPSWLEVRSVSGTAADRLGRLHPGERDAIFLAEELMADMVILDDRAARQAATSLGFRVTGLIGILGEGATRQMIDLPTMVARLRQTSFRVSPAILRDLLERARSEHNEEHHS